MRRESSGSPLLESQTRRAPTDGTAATSSPVRELESLRSASDSRNQGSVTSTTV